VFASLAKSEAEVLGLKDFRLVTVRHPLDNMSREEISKAAGSIVDEVARGLLGDRGVSGHTSASAGLKKAESGS